MSTPTKRTPETAKRIAAILKEGKTRKAAYTAVGISHSTFHDWLDEDESFALVVATAQEHAKSQAVARILKAAKGGAKRTKVTRKLDAEGKVIEETIETSEAEGDWRADAWYLERVDRENFGKNVDVTSKGEKIATPAALIGLSEIESDELDRRIEEAERRKAAQGLPG